MTKILHVLQKIENITAQKQYKLNITSGKHNWLSEAAKCI